MVTRKLLNKFRRRIDERRRKRQLETYVREGRRPWAVGYKLHREEQIQSTLGDAAVLGMFREDEALPSGYGTGLDERIVELPWALSRLPDQQTIALDAGSALNFRYVLESPRLVQRNLIIYTLAPEAVHVRSGVSYVYGDLRRTMIRDGYLDEIICISTLEHVGCDNTQHYTQDTRYCESAERSHLAVIDEFRRMLKSGGRLYLTVPFGARRHLGWMRVFDWDMLRETVEAFAPASSRFSFYRSYSDGWRRVSSDECSNAGYFDVHSERWKGGHLAAAEAVACVEMIR